MKRAALLIAAVVIVAGCVYWFTRSDDDTADNTADTASERVRPSPGQRARPDRTRDNNQPRELSVLADDDPEGSLRLEGLVLDAAELPVGGATVVIDSNPTRTATSEEDGSFFFDKLVARPYRLVARADAGVAGPLTARLSAQSDPVVLRLRPGARLAVTVVDAGRAQPISGATVELRGLDTQTATTGGDGVARIDGAIPGFYRLVAHAPGHAKEFLRIRLTAGGEQTARLALRGGAPVAGVVTDPDGAPIAGARVLYAGASEWAREADPVRDVVITGPDGAFRFDALPAGSFRFNARHDSFAPGSSELVSLDGVTETAGIAAK